jgi:hypothetical protein
MDNGQLKFVVFFLFAVNCGVYEPREPYLRAGY